MKTNNSIALSPYLRITLAGFDVELRTSPTKFRVLLTRGSENIAIAEAPRSGMTKAAAMAKVIQNKYGRTAAMHAVLTKYADIAETMAGASN